MRWISLDAPLFSTATGSSDASVGFDAGSVKTSSNQSTISFQHTTGTGTNRLLIVGVSIKEAKTVSSVTYNGLALTKAGAVSNSGNARAEIWYQVAPPSGTSNVVVKISGNSDIVIGAATFTGVNQTTPLGTFASQTGSTSTASVVAVSAPGEWVFDSVAVRDVAFINAGAGQAQRWNPTAFSNFQGGASTEPGAASVTMSWALQLGKPWAIGTVAIKPALSVFVQTVGANRLWNQTPSLKGQGVTVAVVDSGISSHPDLLATGGNSRVITSTNQVTGSVGTTDGYGHGTFVAGIIGGNGASTGVGHVGIAPEVNLINVKVSDDQRDELLLPT